MLRPNTDIIAAVATAQGRGGIGVVRISGQDISTLASGLLGGLPKARHAAYVDFLDGEGGILDQGVALYFPAPKSYTGEEVLELQGHGGTAVMHMLLKRCLDLGARLAEPGEFTRRAFLNDKIDLAQAEGIADLIDARSTEAARSALRSLCGEFSSTVRELVDQLVHLRTLVEAMLDFPEEDLDGLILRERDSELTAVRRTLQQTLDAARQGSLLREGAHVVIAGRPNVGKSSLLNKLSGEDVALVSDVPGTTRDVIRQEIQIKGVPLHIVDTAGLRESDDIVEKMGIERAHKTFQTADLVLVVLDATQGATGEDRRIIEALPAGVPQLRVLNKADLLPREGQDLDDGRDALHVSAKTGAGLEQLRHEILEAVGWRDQEGTAFMARERHIRALLAAQGNLEKAEAVLGRAELFAEELRLAQRALAEITGEFSADDLLGEIFSKFCIGK